MRHRWIEDSRNEARTVRICQHCELMRISRHEWEGARRVDWTEFWRGTERVQGKGTPKCELVGVDA